MNPLAHAIEIDGLSKAYRVGGQNLQVLDGLSLRAGQGEFVTLIGPSGCGKSTVLNLVAGLQHPDEGEIRFDGVLTEQRLGRCGWMPQRDLLLPWRTVLDNVLLGPEVHGHASGRDRAREEASRLLPLFGLEGFGQSYPATLSGGMRQRAALLRTFLTHSGVLLLDEPFGALDALTRIALQEWLLRVWHEFGYTVLFITHDVEEALFLSDRVYVLTERPARVCLELEVPLPRPRAREMTLSAEFAALKHTLMEALHGRCSGEPPLDSAGVAVDNHSTHTHQE